MAIKKQQVADLAQGNVWTSAPLLKTLSETVSLSKAIEFMASVKAVDQNTNALGASYKNKVVGVCREVIRAKATNNSNIINGISWILASLIGDSQYTYTQVSGASESAKETFTGDNMLKVFELLANVLPEEKADYDSI